MSLFFEERLSDSPFVETVIQGRTLGEGISIRPAEIHWHMVLTKYQGNVRFLVVGPLTTSGVVNWVEGVEILWIKFKLGTFMPYIPTKNMLDRETPMPLGAGNSFCLNGSTLQFPNYENADTFVDRLVRNEELARDPVINAALQDQVPEMPLRTVRHRFLRTTGLTQAHIRQYERAQRAAELLRQGVSILDTVYETGYFDQPHLTKSLKQFVGYTPAQLARLNTSE